MTWLFSLTLQNVCEKLSVVVSKVASLEERLSQDDACVSHLSCDKSVGNPASMNSNSQWLERSLENIVARLTLIENRLSFLEKQVIHSFAHCSYSDFHIINTSLRCINVKYFHSLTMIIIP